MHVYEKGTGERILLDPTKSKGKGGEADIFFIGNGLVVKVFKPPDHPDYNGQPSEQEGARQRINEHQRKLPAFPTNLPKKVIVPVGLVTDRGGSKILGYTMKFLDGAEVLFLYGTRDFRQKGVSANQVVKIFLDLHKTVNGIHKDKVVIGDFNDLNILVLGEEAYFIDADSFQFGQFLCRVFTTQFVDPLLCNPKETRPILSKPYTSLSDWYAFSVMLMRSLLFAGPYDGVFRPKKGPQIVHDARPLRRITVFHPDVRYPKPAIPYGFLSDELLQHFHLVFEKDERGEFPGKLLESVRWAVCKNCGTEHARSVCPNCALVSPLAVKETTIIRGRITATRLFQTRTGVILHAAIQGGKLLWLYHENDAFRREDGSRVLSGLLDPQMRFRIQGRSTIFAKQNQMVILAPNEEPEKQSIDSFGLLPVFDTNSQYKYWLEGGRLLRNDQFGPKQIGDVLSGQTLFWVGETFGFGFYRAGTLSVGFVFDAERTGINDSVELMPIRGQMVDSSCVFAKDHAWFFVSSRDGGKVTNQCMVIRPDGKVEARVSADESEDNWLSRIRGNSAAGNFLLVATDEGIVRVEPDNDQLVVTKKFPDTEPFVDSQTSLFASASGLYAVRQREINQLTIRQ